MTSSGDAQAGSPVRVLSTHAGYYCRHSGACCTSGWPIPIERDALAGLRHALDRRVVVPVAPAGQRLFEFPADAPPDTPAIINSSQGRCVFFRQSPAGHCSIQAQLGPRAVPLACRQFPRLSVLDPRGVSVTLSHYCPTAASMLRNGTPLRIEVNHASFPPTGEYVGLDAAAALPPLLRPGVLMDWESWWEFERIAVDAIAESPPAPAEALTRLRVMVEFVRQWTPGDGVLIARVREAFADPPKAGRPQAPQPLAPFAALALDAVPDDLKPLAKTGDLLEREADVTRGFLAAHAFANWTAHLGAGLRSWLRTIEIAGGLIETGVGVRRADLILRHLAAPDALAEIASRAERD